MKGRKKIRSKNTTRNKHRISLKLTERKIRMKAGKSKKRKKNVRNKNEREKERKKKEMKYRKKSRKNREEIRDFLKEFSVNNERSQ